MERKTAFAPLITLSILILTFAGPAQAQYGGGTGDPNDPYLIYTPEQMNAIGADPNDWDKHFKLMADIDLAQYTGTEFNIIGTSYSYSFRGVFNGNGHAISNFTCKSEDPYFAGLFGRVLRGTIKNLDLIASNVDAGTVPNVGLLVGMSFEGTVSGCSVQGGAVTGGERVGGLIGDNVGTIINCSASCSVDGNSVGGLVGENTGAITGCHADSNVVGLEALGGLVGINGGGRILMCYSTGNVSGDKAVGGLAGQNGLLTLGRERWLLAGRIAYSYSTCKVTGNADVGGLAGLNYAGTVEQCYSNGPVFGSEDVGGLVGHDEDTADAVNCFWDVETSQLAVSSGGTGQTSAQMQHPNTFREVGWDFIGQADGPHDIWAEPEGGGYPILSWQLPAGFGLPTFAGGSGGRDDPYLIATAEQLNSIGHNPKLMTACFELLNDIEATDVESFIIGHKLFPFKGTFDGNNHTISHLTVVGEEYLGMFGVLASDAEVKDLGIIDANVAGSGDYVGGLVGRNSGTLTDCYCTGSVRGDWYVGGLAGHNHEGDILHCYSAGTVDGACYVGGLAGVNHDARLDQCFSVCAANGGGWDVGGLVGANGGAAEIVSCYASGAVVGDRNVGGLVGRNGDSMRPPLNPIRRCYSTGRVSGNSSAGGLVGSSYGDVESSFWDVQTSGQDVSAAGTGLTTVEMQRADTFLEAGWDFVDETENGIEEIWWIDEGRDTPRLWWESANAEL